MVHTIRIVVFDIGGVLVQAGRTWIDDVERAGFVVSSPWREAFEAKLLALPRRSLGAVDSERYFRLFAEASEGVFTHDDAHRISDASLIAEYPGIGRIFDLLDTEGVETAALSNANDAEWGRLFPEEVAGGEFPTLCRIRYRFSSHLLKVAKPDPKVFREVERVTAHSGQRIMFFDDRLENVEAARLFGWHAELIDYTGDTSAQVLASLHTQGLGG